MDVVVPYVRRGDEFVAYNPLASIGSRTPELGLASSMKDIKFHPNGNITYESTEQSRENKPGEMTIVRGEGTVLPSAKSDRPEFQGRGSEFTEFKFDAEGRFSDILPSSADFWSGKANSRAFAYKDNKSTEPDTVSSNKC